MKPNEATCHCTNGDHCSTCCRNPVCGHMADRETRRRIPANASIAVYESTRYAVIADIKRGARF